jgi:hypothetical protein
VSTSIITTGERAAATGGSKAQNGIAGSYGTIDGQPWNLLNVQLIVAGRAGTEGDMSDDQRGSPVTDRLPPAGRAA